MLCVWVSECCWSNPLRGRTQPELVSAPDCCHSLWQPPASPAGEECLWCPLTISVAARAEALRVPQRLRRCALGLPGQPLLALGPAQPPPHAAARGPGQPPYKGVMTS